jgi:hypothetical protein
MNFARGLLRREALPVVVERHVETSSEIVLSGKSRLCERGTSEYGGLARVRRFEDRSKTEYERVTGPEAVFA